MLQIDQNLKAVVLIATYKPAARFIEKIPEREVYLAMVQAYNTWLAEDYTTPAPDRLIANALIPISGIDDAIVPLGQSEGYVVDATAAGARAEIIRVEGDHFVVIDPDSPAWQSQLEILDSIA